MNETQGQEVIAMPRIGDAGKGIVGLIRGCDHKFACSRRIEASEFGGGEGLVPRSAGG